GAVGLHQVGARTADELRDDDALGPVDDEGPELGHHREVAHEHVLLADLARLLVDEADGHVQRGLVSEILLPALLDRDRRRAKLKLAELDGERAGVVLDRRDVVDRLAETLLLEPVERRLLDVDQVRKVEDVLQARETLPRARRGNPCGQVRVPPFTALVCVMRGEMVQTGETTARPTKIAKERTPAQGRACGRRPEVGTIAIFSAERTR